MNIAVLGAGSWGTALARLLHQNGHQVRLWAKRREHIEDLQREGENRRYLPGVPLSPEIRLTDQLQEALADTEMVVLVIPSHGVREICQAIAPLLPPKAIVVNTAKGLEQGTYLRLSQVMEQELPVQNPVAVLTGPSHAEEVARDLPTTVVSAAKERAVAERVQEAFMGPAFRVYTNSDLIGVELGGALKNVIAFCCGIAKGLGFGDNTIAALMTRGLAEITRLGVRLGAHPLTFSGLTGVGDLVVTCTSVHSRNWRAGKLLGEGNSLEETLTKVGMVVEGVKTTKAAREMAQTLGVEMPITEKAYEVLFNGRPAAEGVRDLMGRAKTHEAEPDSLEWN